MNRIWDFYVSRFVHHQRLYTHTTLTIIFYAFSESDGEEAAAESRTGVLVVAPKKMSSALGSLVANYGSMSESESDEEPECECLS